MSFFLQVEKRTEYDSLVDTLASNILVKKFSANLFGSEQIEELDITNKDTFWYKLFRVGVLYDTEENPVVSSKLKEIIVWGDGKKSDGSSQLDMLISLLGKIYAEYTKYVSDLVKKRVISMIDNVLLIIERINEEAVVKGTDVNISSTKLSVVKDIIGMKSPCDDICERYEFWDKIKNGNISETFSLLEGVAEAFEKKLIKDTEITNLREMAVDIIYYVMIYISRKRIQSTLDGKTIFLLSFYPQISLKKTKELFEFTEFPSPLALV